MAGSIEYRTLLRLTSDIELAVQDQLVGIGSKLVSSELITPAQSKEIRNAHNPVDVRAADLVGYIQTRVQQNPPKHYQAFIEVLESDLTQYGDILKKLKDTYDSFAHPPKPDVEPPRSNGTSPKLPVGEGIMRLSSQTILHDKDHTEIYSKLEPAANKWRDIRKALGVTEGEMDNIQSSPMLLMHAPKSWLGQMLSQWLQWAPGDGRGSPGFATKESLRAALLMANLGQLAEQFQ